MSPLQTLQKDFMNWLLTQQPAIKQHVTGTRKVGIEARLGIYEEAYRLRLLEALQDSYPALHTLLGDERFEALAFAYIRHYPSHHFSIRYFGHQLFQFLSSNPDYQDQPFLAEMALFEWTLRDAFDASNSPRLTTADLASIPPEQWGTLTFELHPSVQRIDLSWDVPKLWQAIEQDAPPIQPRQKEHLITWLIWRKDLTTYFRSLEVDEAWAIGAVIQQRNFENLCHGVCEWIDEQHAPERVARFLARWVQEGILARAE